MMFFNRQKLCIAVIFISFFYAQTAAAKVKSIRLIDAFASLPGESGQIGRFEHSDQIDLVFHFEVESDSEEDIGFVWDVYNNYGKRTYAGKREIPCKPGLNKIRIESAIPTDMVGGSESFRVKVFLYKGKIKVEKSFEISIENIRAYPRISIEDVRLEYRSDDPLRAELKGAAIPYYLEVDFRLESIVDFGHAHIYWLAQTSDAYILDRGVGIIKPNEGFNRFKIDSYLARAPRNYDRRADFSVIVESMGYSESVSFGIESIPVSLAEIRARKNTEPDAPALSIGDAFLLTEDNARASTFARGETIIARLLTGGVIPENTKVIMTLTNDLNNAREEYLVEPEPGKEMSKIDYVLGPNPERETGPYTFKWSIMAKGKLYAERSVKLNISDKVDISVPLSVELPGPAKLIVPIGWDVNQESSGDLIATLTSPSGVICQLSGQTLDEPLNVSFLAEIFESDPRLSQLPQERKFLTEEKDEREGMWQYLRRAFITARNVYVIDYWMYKIENNNYEFLYSKCIGNENQILDTYASADQIKSGITYFQ